MALKRRLSAEVEFAKKRLQAALAQDQGDGPASHELHAADARGEGGGRAQVQRCYDFESCAASARERGGGGGGGGGGGFGDDLEASVGGFGA